MTSKYLFLNKGFVIPRYNEIAYKLSHTVNNIMYRYDSVIL